MIVPTMKLFGSSFTNVQAGKKAKKRNVLENVKVDHVFRSDPNDKDVCVCVRS